MNTFRLQSHPSTPCDFIDAVDVTVEQQGSNLRCRYEVRGTVERLAIPAMAPAPARTDELWRQTCFEIFLKPEDGTIYDEFNFSPSGHWAAWRFEHYRTGRVELELGSAPRITCRNEARRLSLEVVVPGGECNRPRLALSVVLKDRDGATCYWALQHPPGKPDFHHDAGFAAALAKP